MSNLKSDIRNNIATKLNKYQNTAFVLLAKHGDWEYYPYDIADEILKDLEVFLTGIEDDLK